MSGKSENAKQSNETPVPWGQALTLRQREDHVCRGERDPTLQTPLVLLPQVAPGASVDGFLLIL